VGLVLYAATYDGVSLVTVVAGMPRMLIGLVRGLDDAPEVRGSDTIIPGAAGRVPRTRVRDRWVIELAGPVGGVGTTHAAQAADVRAALEELRTLFDPTRDPAALSVELEDGGTAVISARPVNLLLDEPVVPTMRRVSIELEAVEGPWVITPGGP
jgi:hypothetical protein